MPISHIDDASDHRSRIFGKSSACGPHKHRYMSCLSNTTLLFLITIHSRILYDKAHSMHTRVESMVGVARRVVAFTPLHDFVTHHDPRSF